MTKYSFSVTSTNPELEVIPSDVIVDFMNVTNSKINMIIKEISKLIGKF